MAELGPGAELAGYRIEVQVGRGGMGVVYRATQLDLGRTVALKLIAPELAQDESFRARFQEECRTAAAIDHPNVIPLFEAGEAEGNLFLAMRFVSGTDLRTLIDEQGGLDLARAVSLIDGIGAALDAAHKRGLVHRDVKPANVLVTSEGGRDHVYLTDFGLTKQVGSVAKMTETGQWVGTIDYVSPEQIEGKRTDARADVYALGCVLFEMLTGQPPFQRDSHTAKLFAHISEPPPRVSDSRPDVPEAMDEVVSRAMAKSPDDRFPSAGDLARAARSATTGKPISQPEKSVARGAARSSQGDTPQPAGTTLPPPGASEGATRRLAERPPRRGKGRRGLLLAGALGAVVAAGTVAALLLLGDDDGGSESAELARLRDRADEICVLSRNEYSEAATAPADSKAETVQKADQLADISAGALRQLRRLDPPAEITTEYTSYLELRRKMVHQLRNAAQAVKEEDDVAYSEALERIDEGAQERYDAARALGLKYCSRSAQA